MIGYKLFRVTRKHPGKLYPMFVLADQETEMGVWLPAKEGIRLPDGKVKSRLGPLCFRPGWHLSDLPLATHIGVKEDGKVRYQRPDTVWCECEYSDHIHYHPETYLKTVPLNGFYRFKTSSQMYGDWVIAGSIRVLRVLPDAEVDEVLRSHGLSPMPRYGGPMDLSSYGF